MFTGIVSHVAQVARVASTPAGRELSISSPWNDLEIGESIALNGTCLTVVKAPEGQFVVEAIHTTCERTTVGGWTVGSRVNLERALRMGDRLGGHLVQGHVDGVGDVHAAERSGDALLIDVALWDAAGALCIPQGSIAIDGVSLTILALPSPGVARVAIIDHTRTHTTLGALRARDRVNIELDMIGKYVRQLAAPWGASPAVLH